VFYVANALIVVVVVLVAVVVGRYFLFGKSAVYSVSESWK